MEELEEKLVISLSKVHLWYPFIILRSSSSTMKSINSQAQRPFLSCCTIISIEPTMHGFCLYHKLINHRLSKCNIWRQQNQFRSICQILCKSLWTHCFRKKLLRIELNTFVPNSNIFQMRLWSGFKTIFKDFKSKFWNVLLHTFQWEMCLKFTPYWILVGGYRLFWKFALIST